VVVEEALLVVKRQQGGHAAQRSYAAGQGQQTYSVHSCLISFRWICSAVMHPTASAPPIVVVDRMYRGSWQLLHEIWICFSKDGRGGVGNASRLGAL